MLNLIPQKSQLPDQHAAIIPNENKVHDKCIQVQILFYAVQKIFEDKSLMITKASYDCFEFISYYLFNYLNRSLPAWLSWLLGME